MSFGTAHQAYPGEFAHWRSKTALFVSEPSNMQRQIAERQGHHGRALYWRCRAAVVHDRALRKIDETFA